MPAGFAWGKKQISLETGFFVGYLGAQNFWNAGFFGPVPKLKMWGAEIPGLDRTLGNLQMRMRARKLKTEISHEEIHGLAIF